MRQAAGFFTVLAFFLWIQPLGAFLRPTQESTVCGGLRAFHMCNLLTPTLEARERSAHPEAKLTLTAAGTFDPTHRSMGGGFSCDFTAPVAEGDGAAPRQFGSSFVLGHATPVFLALSLPPPKFLLSL